MRFRILTVAPLPELKTWFIFPNSTSPSGQSIADLKNDIFKRVESLKDTGLQGDDVALLLDGFELLDTDPVQDLVRDGEIISIQLSPIKSSTKRKFQQGKLVVYSCDLKKLMAY